MLRIVLMFALTLLVGAPDTVFQSDPAIRQVAPDFELQKGKAGPVELGQTVDHLYARFGRDNVQLVDLFLEGLFSPAVQIRIPGEEAPPALVARIREWPCAEFSVWGITVRDRRFRTKDGFGVGSTLGELRKRYPTEVGWGEGERIAHVAALGMTFMLDDSAESTDLWAVRAVWIVPQPVQVRQARCPYLGPLGRLEKVPRIIGNADQQRPTRHQSRAGWTDLGVTNRIEKARFSEPLGARVTRAS